MTVGQEFHAFGFCPGRRDSAAQGRREVPVCGQHGRDRHRHRHQRPQGLSAAVAAELAKLTKKPIVPATDMIAATWDQQGFVVYSSALKSMAINALQDRERPDPARLRAARRPQRDRSAGAAARLVDHAGQGQPGHARAHQRHRLPRDRQRRRQSRSPRTAGSCSSTPTNRSKALRSWNRSSCCSMAPRHSAPSASTASSSTKRCWRTTWKRPSESSPR